MKRCTSCKKEKGTQHFAKNRAKKDGLQCLCSPCLSKARRASREKNSAKPCSTCGHEQRATGQTMCADCCALRNTMSRYGVTLEKAVELRSKKQCDACGRTEEEVGGGSKIMHIDHCHDEGHVRGVLCIYCNTALGSLLDDPMRILKLGMYLNRAMYDKSNTTSAS